MRMSWKSNPAAHMISLATSPLPQCSKSTIFACALIAPLPFSFVTETMSLASRWVTQWLLDIMPTCSNATYFDEFHRSEKQNPLRITDLIGAVLYFPSSVIINDKRCTNYFKKVLSSFVARAWHLLELDAPLLFRPELLFFLRGRLAFLLGFFGATMITKLSRDGELCSKWF